MIPFDPPHAGFPPSWTIHAGSPDVTILSQGAFRRAVREARRHQLGTLVWAPHPTAGLGQRHAINVWVHDRSPDWRLSMDIGNLDLSLLTAYKLKKNWKERNERTRRWFSLKKAAELVDEPELAALLRDLADRKHKDARIIDLPRAS